MVSSMRGLATAEVVDRIGQHLSVESQGAWRQTSALHGKVMKAFPAKAFGDSDSFRMAIAKDVFPRGWKDIPDDKRNLPFVFRIALEEGLLNGVGSLELGKARQMAADEDAELLGTAIEKGLFPRGWKDIPKRSENVHSCSGLRKKSASAVLPRNNLASHTGLKRASTFD